MSQGVTRAPFGHWLLLVSSTDFSLFPAIYNTKTNSISLFTLAANCLTPIDLDESVIAYRSQTGCMEAVTILKCSTTVVGSS